MHHSGEKQERDSETGCHRRNHDKRHFANQRDFAMDEWESDQEHSNIASDHGMAHYHQSILYLVVSRLERRIMVLDCYSQNGVDWEPINHQG